ncbi:hypothetical protein LPW26_16010 [Rhodopseudomonas sp. HC1]|uniref:hypothetical protein n=1 Tax=Rhodopseudomonas infernalis TaxID=2897386 RepID=UPI001EE802EB|nr:hypothetical protein [Rhodopseudomonas infernalis]MCG6206155.1 hypothetical protein [Rhodopseudomonas infernalis]
MTPSWSGWKHYPQGGLGNIDAPIGPGIYEVRRATDGGMFAFDVVENLAMALAKLQTRPKRLGWFGRRGGVALPELEYRYFPTRSWEHARLAADHMLSRRESWFNRAA